MFFLAKKEMKEMKDKEINLKDKLIKITKDTIKSYTKGALLGAFIKSPDLETMNSSGIKMVKMNLLKTSLNNFFDNFIESEYLNKNIDYMPLSAFIAGSVFVESEDEEVPLKDRFISGVSFSSFSILEKYSEKRYQ